MKSSNNYLDTLADLGAEDTHITLESTLERVVELRRRRAQHRIVGTVFATLALLTLGFWAFMPPSSPVPESLTKADVANTLTNIPANVLTNVPANVLTNVPANPVTSVERATQPTRRVASAPLKAPYTKVAFDRTGEIRHDMVLRALDFDKAVYEEITTTIGINDDVVMVTNSTNKQTCMQVVCEGGDARTLYCSAPSPSPVMITSPSGRQMMRVEGGVTPSSHLVALRTQLHRDSVLVWYEASPAFLARFHRATSQLDAIASATVVEQSLTRVDLQRCAPSRMIDGSIRMDVTRCGSHERVVRVDLSDLAGRPIPTEATYTQGDNGNAAIVLSSVPAGVAYVRLVSEDGASDTFPVAVP